MKSIKQKLKRFFTNVLVLLGLIVIALVFLFPIIIAFIEGNPWLIMLYLVWWGPALLITGIFIGILKELT